MLVLKMMTLLMLKMMTLMMMINRTQTPNAHPNLLLCGDGGCLLCDDDVTMMDLSGEDNGFVR